MNRILLAAVAAAIAGPALAQTAPIQIGQSTAPSVSAASSAPAKMDDATFVSMAAMSNLAEIHMGEIALQKTQNEEVRKHARLMIDDHKKAQAQLEQVTNLPMPKEIDAKHKQMADKLSAASGADFDRLYAEMQADAHEQAIQLHTAQVERGSNGELKRLASELLPKLREHLTITQTLAKAVGAKIAPSKAS
jgi:putative membrane protein